MGVATARLHPLYENAPRAPLLKFLEITPAHNLQHNSQHNTTQRKSKHAIQHTQTHNASNNNTKHAKSQYNITPHAQPATIAKHMGAG